MRGSDGAIEPGTVAMCSPAVWETEKDQLVKDHTERPHIGF
jgi:hypothetical protein